MENEAFIAEVKAGFGVFILGILCNLFKRMIRGLTILERKLTDAIEKRLPLDAVA